MDPGERLRRGRVESAPLLLLSLASSEEPRESRVGKDPPGDEFHDKEGRSQRLVASLEGQDVGDRDPRGRGR